MYYILYLIYLFIPGSTKRYNKEERCSQCLDYQIPVTVTQGATYQRLHYLVIKY